MIRDWIWKSAASGLCGSAAHGGLMYFKARAGILPSFQPYENFQVALGHLIGRDVDPLVPWLLSYVNGSTFVGLSFGYLYRRLPTDSGALKGLIFGLAGWLVMNLLAFPMVGLGIFAAAAGLGLWPALFSMAMLSTYSVVMGMVYSALERRSAIHLEREPG
jgi:hypothetical protein